MEPFIHGLLLAFGLILPLGVQNVFVFSQGASQAKLVRALPATLTASLCDTLLITGAVLGLSIIVLQLEWLRIMLMSVGILFLTYMAYSIWNTKLTSMETKATLSMKKQIGFTLSVSLLNPHAIMDTIGVIGTSALRYEGEEKLIFTLVCILVSWIWFLSLTIAGYAMKKIDQTGRLMPVINKCSAVFIGLTAIWLLRDLFTS